MDFEQYRYVMMKKRLDDYRELEYDIDNQIERLERLKGRMLTVGAQVISDMPRSPSPDMDRMSGYLIKAEKLEESVRLSIKERDEQKEAIESLVKTLPKANQRAVIRMRYFDCLEWKNVTDMIFGTEEDYLEKRDSYLRTVMNLHHNAVAAMARLALPESTQAEG